MSGVKEITYREWIDLVRSSRRLGMQCKEFEELKMCYPKGMHVMDASMIYNELANLETDFLRTIIYKYQQRMNLCINERDIEIAEQAIRRLNTDINKCMFFCDREIYPEIVQLDLKRQVEEKLRLFLGEFRKHLKQLNYEDNSGFVDELIYICGKKHCLK